jgi:Raf kinase inhibitor-like YbhB/YbcL family protein
MEHIELRSSTFDDHGFIPDRHSYVESNVPPALEWIGVPPGAVELVLLCEDLDTPKRAFLHWLVTGIDPATPGVSGDSTAIIGREWPNDFGEQGWGGPAPPRGDDVHRYRFRLFALTASIELPDDPTAGDVHEAADGIAAGQGKLVGLFQR